MILLITGVISNTYIVGLEIVVDVPDFVQVFEQRGYLDSNLPDGLEGEQLTVHRVDYVL